MAVQRRKSEDHLKVYVFTTLHLGDFMNFLVLYELFCLYIVPGDTLLLNELLTTFNFLSTQNKAKKLIKL